MTPPSHRRRAADDVLAPRPTARTALPFAVLAAAGLTSVLVPPYHLHQRRHAWELAVAVLLLPALGWLFRQVLRRDRRSWVDPAAPWLSVAAVVLLRDVTGGSGSGLGPLVALPVMWLALFGTRRDLVVGAGVVAVALLTPTWLVGGRDYPAGEWWRAVLWVGVATVLAPVVQQVVHRAGAGSAEQRRLSTQLAGILRGSTLTGLVTTDPDGQITTFGVGTEELCGCTEQDMLGRAFADLVHDPAEMDRVAAELGVDPGFPVLARLAARRAPSRTWVCVRADGEPLVVRLALSELRDDTGGLTGYLAVAVDETEAVRTQHELTASEARWRVLMDHLPDTVVVLVEQGSGITLVTGGGLLGHRVRDSAGRWLQELGERAGVPIGRMLEAAFAGEEQMSSADASVEEGDHEVLVSPLPTATGRPQALVMVRDVSWDRRRQRAITAAKERAERLFQDAPQGIAVLTPRGEMVQVNPAMSRLFGRDDLVGRPLSMLSFRPHDTTVLDHLDAVLAGGPGHAVTQWSVRAADGTEAHVVLTSTVLAGEDGERDVVLTNLVDVSDRHRYEQQLAHLADHDPLTGLANRRRFDAELTRHVDECRRYGARGALLVLDLDHFKEVNDTLGHAAGDELLRMVGTVLKDRLRSTDVVARLGGDEFAVLLPHGDRKAAELVAQSVVDQVRERLAGMADTRGDVTVSVGGALLDDPGLTASDWLSLADSAMYAAKGAGRNQYALHG